MDLVLPPGLPEPEGFRATGQAVTDAAPLAVPTFKARSLHELSADFAFMNHGALLTRGALTVDPVIDFCEQHNVPEHERPLLYQASRPFFSGIDTYYDPSEGRPCWDRVLLMCPKHRWPALFAHLCAVAAVDTLRRNFFWSKPSEFQIAEHSEDALVPVTMFGVDSNYGLFAFTRYASDPTWPITLCHFSAVPSTVEFAKQLFQGASKPYRAIELETANV